MSGEGWLGTAGAARRADTALRGDGGHGRRRRPPRPHLPAPTWPCARHPPTAAPALRGNAPRAAAVCPSTRAVPLARSAESSCTGALVSWRLSARGNRRGAGLVRDFPGPDCAAEAGGPTRPDPVGPDPSQPRGTRRDPPPPGGSEPVWSR